MIIVMGATGHTGKKVTEALLKAGEQVRALGRSESKLAELKSAGAEVLIGDATNAAFLTKAFRGADAVYTLLPTDPGSPDYRAEQDRQGEAIVQAIRESGVQYVVALSSLGAALSEGTGVIVGLHAQEDGLKQLRTRMCCCFVRYPSSRISMARLGLSSRRKSCGLCCGGPRRPDDRNPRHRRCGGTGAQGPRLAGRRRARVARPARPQLCEATRILGERIGKPDLQYIQFSYADEAQALAQAGMSESFAGLYVEMTRAFNDGKVKPQRGRTPENTTPTRFEDFAHELARAYEAM